MSALGLRVLPPIFQRGLPTKSLRCLGLEEQRTMVHEYASFTLTLRQPYAAEIAALP